jgi:hypothetical protein
VWPGCGLRPGSRATLAHPCWRSIATDWVKWTAIATFILGVATLLLVLVTMKMVQKASAEIAIERQRIDEATRPRIFPAPARGWGTEGYRGGALGGDWRRVLPVTNGGPGVALNVRAGLRWGTGEQPVAETIPTSLGPGESRELIIKWQTEEDRWGQLRGLLHYRDIAGALWQTRFTIEEEEARWLVEVQETEMISPPGGGEKNGTAGRAPRRFPSVPFGWKLRNVEPRR